MDDGNRFIKNPDVIVREEGDGAFLFDANTGNLKYMNETAKETFLLLEKEMDLKQITERIIDSYNDAEPSEVMNHVKGFVKDLMENQFIRIIDGKRIQKDE
jgi:hypothetical protein